MNSSKSTKWNIKSGINILIWSLLLILLDQVTKILARLYLKDQPPKVMIDGVFELHYLENPWAAFSLGKGLNSFFLILVLILTIGFSVFLIFLSFRVPAEKRFWFIHLLIILFLSGALGNFIDRVKFHSVTDFFYFKLINFPIFNVADIYVVAGAILFVVSFLLRSSIYEELFPSRKKGASKDNASHQDPDKKE